MANTVVVEGNLDLHANHLVVDDTDLFDKVQEHAALRRHWQLAKVVLEGGGEALELCEVELVSAAVVVVLPEQLSLCLDLTFLRLKACDVFATSLPVESIANGAVVVLDTAVDVSETAIQLAGILTVATAARLNLLSHELLKRLCCNFGRRRLVT